MRLPNPAIWNGFKFKTKDGAGAPGEVTAEIERRIGQTLVTGKINQIPLAKALEQGSVECLDLAPIYFQHVAKLVDLNELRQARLKVVVDPMYGSGAGYLKALLDGGTIEVVEINSERNPLFPTLQVFALLCLYLLEVRGERGLIVKTITTTSMLYRLGEIFNVPVGETPVGFKYVAPIMLAENALVGGEESGGFGFRGHMPERDGILSALYFLDLTVKTGKNPSELIDYLYSKVGPHYFDRVDVEFPERERQAIIERIEHSRPEYIDGVKVAEFDTADGFRFVLADTTWLLIRFSGTEPLLRLYAESSTPARVEKLLELGKKLAGV